MKREAIASAVLVLAFFAFNGAFMAGVKSLDLVQAGQSQSARA